MTRVLTLRGCLLAALMAALAPLAGAQSLASAADEARAGRQDNLDHPLGKKQMALRQQGLHKLLKGERTSKGPNKVVEVAKGQ